MSDRSKIEWTDASWNPVRATRINVRDGATRTGWHCEHVSEGCRNCYAERINLRLGTGLAFKPGHLHRTDDTVEPPVLHGDVSPFLDEKMLTQPLRWKRARRIFVGSMTDLFADFVTDDTLDRIFAVMALCPQHTFQVLTKRPARMRAYCAAPDTYKRAWTAASDIADTIHALAANGAAWGGETPWPLRNVWLGVSAEDQATADERIPLLLATPAAVRFVSYEPALGPVDFRPWLSEDDGCESCDDGGDGPPRCSRSDIPREQQCPRNFAVEECDVGPTDSEGVPEYVGMRRIMLDWIICGGESGSGARPMHPDWARSVRDQCAVAGVPFFFKQWGEWVPVYDRDRDDPDWQNCRVVEAAPVRGQWLNLAGGQGFHGERVVRVNRVGKKAAGRLLDGRTHDAFPELAR